MVRLAHISDIHITSRDIRWTWNDVLSKRMAAWMNLRLLGRGYRFRHAASILPSLMRELIERRIDHLIFSGDATAMGFEAEFADAARLLQVNTFPVPGLAVPGNHDYCNKTAEESGLFERYFRRWQQGRRVDHHVYPFAQRVGQYWLIGVNGAVGNRMPWNATGRVGDQQLARLRALLASLEPGPRILVNHFPMFLASGRPESRFRRLKDLGATIPSAVEGGVRLWLHGHRHKPYHVKPNAQAPFSSICAGATTQTGICSYHEYSLDHGKIDVLRRQFDHRRQQFVDAEDYSIAWVA